MVAPLEVYNTHVVQTGRALLAGTRWVVTPLKTMKTMQFLQLALGGRLLASSGRLLASTRIKKGSTSTGGDPTRWDPLGGENI